MIDSAETELYTLCQQLGEYLVQSNQRLVTVESCTGGGIAAAITNVPGSSAWFERGFVTYSNEAKHELVGVDLALVAKHGAVSEPVAAAMAKGGQHSVPDSICISVTGIAGPDGGSAEKPVGTVCFGLVRGDAVITTTQFFGGDRQAVRRAAVEFALRDWVYRLG